LQNKTGQLILDVLFFLFRSVVLERYNVLSLGVFLALDDGKFYSLTFIEGLIAFAEDSVEVNENISASVALDEAVAFTTLEFVNQHPQFPDKRHPKSFTFDRIERLCWHGIITPRFD